MKLRIKIAMVAIVLGLAFPAAQGFADLLNNSSFEVSENTADGLPSLLGDWSGDDSAIVTAQQGIQPRTGSQMLHHEFTGLTGQAGGALGASEITQLVDLAPFSSLVASGNAIANGSVFANRIAGDLQTDTSFIVQIYAMTGNISSFTSIFPNSSAVTTGEIFTDSDPTTWEKAETQLLIPTNATYLAFLIATRENIQNDLSGTEFDGHYTDDANLTITAIPEPNAIGAFAIVSAILAVRRCKAGGRK